MPDTKITALTAISTVDPAVDVLPIVDVSDTTMAASGTTKKITSNQILGAGGTATLASATITGALTAGTGSTTSPITEYFNDVSANTDYGSALSVRSNANASVYLQRLVATRGSFADSMGWKLTTQSGGGTEMTAWTVGPTGINNWFISGSTAMTLNATGLGVGTASPAQKVDVNGALLATNVYLRSDDSDVSWGAGAGSRPIIRGNQTNNTIKFYTASTERMTLDSSGNLGVGVTPSAWQSGYTVIDLKGGPSLFTNSSISAPTIASNWFINSSAQSVYKANGFASYYTQYNSAHTWGIAATGIAGALINGTGNFTTAMTLDASGNLLVGVATNPNTARAYFRYDTLTTQPVINSASIVAAGTTWNHFVGQSGNGSSITTNNIFIRGNGDVANANGVYGTISDLRLKENISDARNYLADLLKLRVVKYSLKSEESAVATKIGFIAQEVEQVFPSLITTDTDDNKSIKTSVLIPMLLKAIQELTARVEALEA